MSIRRRLFHRTNTAGKLSALLREYAHRASIDASPVVDRFEAVGVAVAARAHHAIARCASNVTESSGSRAAALACVAAHLRMTDELTAFLVNERERSGEAAELLGCARGSVSCGVGSVAPA